jgi:hypothetical protein
VLLDPILGRLSSLLCYCRRFIPALESNFRIYSFLAIHVVIASMTALDKSPFFPPNLSIVLNLSCFSSSPESSTHIRPIFNQLLLEFLCTVRRVRSFSNKRIARFQVSRLFLLLSFLTHLSLIHIVYYMLTLLYVYWFIMLSI